MRTSRANQTRKVEVASSGFDDFAQLAPADPGGTPTATPVRIPTLAGVQYSILLAVADVFQGDHVTAIRTGLDIGAAVSAVVEDSPPPYYARKRPIVSPTFRFSDGGYSFILTSENKPYREYVAGPWDQESFVFDDCDGPAVLYESAAFPGVKTAPGYLGLNGYTPAPMRGTVELMMRDMREPWALGRAHMMDLRYTSTTRLRLYCFVEQTNPDTRPIADTPSTFPLPLIGAPTGLMPEDNFLLMVPGAQYFAAYGAIVVEALTNEAPAYDVQTAT
jgi:hypothetical protein